MFFFNETHSKLFIILLLNSDKLHIKPFEQRLLVSGCSSVGLCSSGLLSLCRPTEGKVQSRVVTVEFITLFLSLVFPCFLLPLSVSTSLFFYISVTYRLWLIRLHWAVNLKKTFAAKLAYLSGHVTVKFKQTLTCSLLLPRFSLNAGAHSGKNMWLWRINHKWKMSPFALWRLAYWHFKTKSLQRPVCRGFKRSFNPALGFANLPFLKDVTAPSLSVSKEHFLSLRFS